MALHTNSCENGKKGSSLSQQELDWKVPARSAQMHWPLGITGSIASINTNAYVYACMYRQFSWRRPATAAGSTAAGSALAPPLRCGLHRAGCAIVHMLGHRSHHCHIAGRRGVRIGRYGVNARRDRRREGQHHGDLLETAGCQSYVCCVSICVACDALHACIHA